jgi:hypothetical protein
VSEADGSEVIPDSWKLPEGMRVSEAARRMSDADKKLLHKQAYDQAGNFEVLHKRDVASLSRVSSYSLVQTTNANIYYRNSERSTSAVTTCERRTSLYERAAKSYMAV